MVDYTGETRGNVRLPGVMMLGYVAAHSENLAMAVIVSKVRIGRMELCWFIELVIVAPLALIHLRWNVHGRKAQKIIMLIFQFV